MNKLNDYIINVGQTWDNLTPFDMAVSKKRSNRNSKTFNCQMCRSRLQSVQ